MGDTLPQESSTEAVQDEGLVDPTLSIFGDNEIYRRDNSVHIRPFLLARRVFLIRLL